MFGETPLQWPQVFAFVLIPQFSMIALSSAIEPLRHANGLSDQKRYEWSIYAPGGVSVDASNGITMTVNGDLGDVPANAIIVVCGGPNIERNTSPKLLSWLRMRARHGGDIGALCTASHVLAKAGLLNNRRCTTHWEDVDAFRENFPDLSITDQLIEIDKDRFTCAGETAAIDLMVSMIAGQLGESLARGVSDQVLHPSVRSASQAQRTSLMGQVGSRHPALALALQTMESHLEEPLSLVEIARSVGLSRRQMERLFRKYLGRAPQRHYRELRLMRARSLILQTNMEVSEIAVSCGFSSTSHFTKCYRDYFLQSPYKERGISS